MSGALFSRRGHTHLTSLLSWLAASAFVLSTAVSGSLATPFEAEEDSVDEPSVTAPIARLTIAPDVAVLPVNSEEYRFEALLQNLGEEPLEEGMLTLWLDGVRTESRSALEAEREAHEPEVLAQVAVTRTPGEGAQEFAITVPRSELPRVSTREAGVYMLRAEYRVAAGPVINSAIVSAATPIVWGGVAGPPLALTVIVPFVLPPQIVGVPTASELTALAPRLTELLTAAETHAATLAVDPRIVAGIRGLGTAAPNVALGLLERLEATQNPVFMLQFSDADPAVQAALGYEQLMQPLGFGYITAAGTFEPPESPPPVVLLEMQTPPLGDGTPSRAQMIELANAQPGAWPAENDVDTETLALLERSGIASSIVLSSANVSEATGTRATVGEFETLIADERLGAAASGVLVGATLIEQRAAAAQLASLTALDARAEAGGVILALDRAAITEAANPLAVLNALDELPWVRTAAEDEQPQGTAALRAGGSTEDRRERLRAMVMRSAQIDALAPLLVEPEFLLEYQSVRLLGAFATRYASQLVDFAEIDAAMREQDQQLLEGVRPVSTESIQLVGASSRVPVTLRNWLPFDAVVQLRAAPLSATISVPERQFEAILTAGGTESVLVPVQSRVSSGQATLLLEVRDATGEQLFAEAALPLTLRSSVETMLLLGLGAAATLLLGLGIWRSVRQRHRFPT